MGGALCASLVNFSYHVLLFRLDCSGESRLSMVKGGVFFSQTIRTLMNVLPGYIYADNYLAFSVICSSSSPSATIYVLLAGELTAN